MMAQDGNKMATPPTDTSFRYSEFTPVTSRKKRRGKEPADRPSPSVLVQRTRDDLEQENWFSHCRQILREALSAISSVIPGETPPSDTTPDVQCLGLGSAVSSSNSRAQLGLLLDICDTLSIDRTRVSSYDPVFTEQDHSLFTELHFRTIPDNKIGDYGITVPTIFFMPHCDIDLYESVLKANWAPERLSRIILVCNRLGDYVENNPTHKLQAQAPHLLKIVPFLSCQPLPPSTSWPTAFNNTSIQFLRTLPEPDTWVSDICKPPPKADSAQDAVDTGG